MAQLSRYDIGIRIDSIANATDIIQSLVVLLLLIHCLSLLPLIAGVYGKFSPCFVMQYFVCFLVLQSSCCERKSWVFYLICLSDVF